jgi:hypothetical protein
MAYKNEQIEKAIIIFLLDFPKNFILDWTKKNVVNHAIMNSETHVFIIQSNHDDQLLPRANASIIATLLWNTNIVNISTIYNINIMNIIMSLNNLKLRFFIQ